MPNAHFQVQDDYPLLEKMMGDLAKCDTLYRPTCYWSSPERAFLNELRSKGLKDFRRRRGSVLVSFGAVDLQIKGDIHYQPPFRFPGLGRINRVLFRMTRLLEKWHFTFHANIFHDPGEVTRYFFRHVRGKFDRSGVDIHRCPSSLWGNPEDIVEIDGSYWSLSHLQYCSMFIDAARHIEFSPDMVYCELGAGMGRSVEVLAHLYPEATFFLFDIPPQVYVSYQYLSKVFGDRLVKYEQAILLTPGENDVLPDHARGKIILLPSWCMPLWSKTKMDIFWNSASFQEMEPVVVNNYLSIVKRMKPTWIYINALPQGKEDTNVPVSENHYFESLANDYDLACSYETDYFLRNQGYVSYVFKGKEKQV